MFQKWTLRIIAHVFDLAVVKSWHEYQKDKACLDIPQQYILNLQCLKIAKALVHIAEAFVRTGKQQGKEEDQACHKAHHSNRKLYGKPLLNEGQLKMSAVT